MNFASAATLEAAARGAGFRDVAPDAAPRFDALLLRAARALLEPAALVSSHRTVQPEHFAALRRIRALLVDGHDAEAAHARQRQVDALLAGGGAGGTVMAGEFFRPGSAAAGPGFVAQAGGARPQAGGARRGRQGGGGAGGTAMAGEFFRPGSAAAGPGFAQAGGAGGDAGAAFAAHRSTFPAAASLAAQSGGGGGGAVIRAAMQPSLAFPLDAHAQAGGGAAWGLPDEALTRVLREYRARSGRDVRVSEAARRYLGAYLVRNVDAVLRAAARAAKGKAKRLTGAALERAARKWRPELL